MGMPLYGAVPPTGYKWDASDWVSTGALVARMNFALTLTSNKLPGIAITFVPPTDSDSLVAKIDGSAQGALPTPEVEEQRLEALLVDGGVSPSTRVAVLDQFKVQTQAQNQGTGKPQPVAAKPLNPAQVALSLERQDQLLAGLLLGSPEFQRR